MLQEFDYLPAGLLDQEATTLHTFLPGPTLIHLPGERAEPLFVSVLLHGNEVTGWEALRHILKKYQGQRLPRALSVFIGNVAAARHGQRCLPTQPDYNRIWKGEGDSAESVMVRQVLERMRARRVFACIDIHNNTGRNPHYACLNELEQGFFHLARLFSRTVVYFRNPDSVLSLAFARLCPAITVECGRPSEPQGVAHAAELIDSCLHLSEHPRHAMHPQDLDLFHTVAVVKVALDVVFAIAGPQGTPVANPVPGLCLRADLDQLNFCELRPGTPLATVPPAERLPLHAWDEQQQDIAARFFAVVDGQLVTKIPLMPSMLTLQTDIIRQDCLCYLMERLPLSRDVEA
ncbi:MAG: M14 family metallopeptidase [Gammaproteobacteria bacterium]